MNTLLMIVGLALSPYNDMAWKEVSDLEMRQAQELSSETVVFRTRYDSGLMEVVHLVGHTYYRILTWDGDVYYSYSIVTVQ